MKDRDLSSFAFNLLGGLLLSFRLMATMAAILVEEDGNGFQM